MHIYHYFPKIRQPKTPRHSSTAFLLLGLYGTLFSFSGNGNHGAVYLFNPTGDYLAKFKASDGRAQDSFGASVASRGNAVFIGTNYGHKAYVFDLVNETQVHKLTATDGEAADCFGRGVEISGNVIMVSATHQGNGAVYTFDVTSGGQLQKFNNTDTPPSSY